MKSDLLVEWDFKLEDAELAKKGSASSPNPLQSLVFSAEEEEDEVTVARLFSSLQKMAEAADMEGTPIAKDFLVTLMHGQNTKRKTGRIADAYQGRARRDLVNKSCVHRSLQVTKRFGLEEWTEEGSLTMCQEWCERMQFFWNVCVAQRDPGLVFHQPLLDKYKETQAFTDFALTITKPEMKNQVMELRTFCPS